MGQTPRPDKPSRVRSLAGLPLMPQCQTCRVAANDGFEHYSLDYDWRIF